MSRMLEPGPNPHIQKFMERKAPKGYGTPRVNKKQAEEDSGICYPKDTLRETILLCVPCHAHPYVGPASVRGSRSRADDTALYDRRKNTPMRMACKLPGEVPPKPEAPDCHGRAKSDITTGHENLYERSYYS